MARFGGYFDEAVGSAGCGPASCRDSALYRVVLPEQSVVARVNGLDPDGSTEGYLPVERPYGVLRMAWAIWREVPDVEPKAALSLALRVRRKGEAEVMVATPFLAEHTRMRLQARHRLAARLECAG